MNETIFLAINGLAGRSHLFDVLGVFLADKFLYVFALIILGLWFNKRLRPYVYLALGSALIARGVIVEILKRIIDHPRPYEIVGNIHQLLVDNEQGMSFPSGHTVIFFSFAFSFWGTKYFWPFLIMAIIGSLARVFVGVHFPWDVLASIFIAGIVVWLGRRLFQKKLV